MVFKKKEDSKLRKMCQDIIDDSPTIVADIRGGYAKSIGSLMSKANELQPGIALGAVKKVCLDIINDMDCKEVPKETEPDKEE